MQATIKLSREAAATYGLKKPELVIDHVLFTPEVMPSGALRILANPRERIFAAGSWHTVEVGDEGMTAHASAPAAGRATAAPARIRNRKAAAAA